MFTTKEVAITLAEQIVAGLGKVSPVEVAVCPPSPYLDTVGSVVHGTLVGLGAQNVYPETEGAFTGETGLGMLRDLGCQWVIVGHSERRQKLGETDQFINKKIHAVLAAGLQVIACIGETLQERQLGKTQSILQEQIKKGLAGLNESQIANLVIAYEPVWAIGTGVNATPEQAQEACQEIRSELARLFGQKAADHLRIQYGGSMNATNAASLLHLPDIDGGLIGGASLKADMFLSIIQSAARKC